MRARHAPNSTPTSSGLTVPGGIAEREAKARDAADNQVRAAAVRIRGNIGIDWVAVVLEHIDASLLRVLLNRKAQVLHDKVHSQPQGLGS